MQHTGMSVQQMEREMPPLRDSPRNLVLLRFVFSSA